MRLSIGLPILWSLGLLSPLLIVNFGWVIEKFNYYGLGCSYSSNDVRSLIHFIVNSGMIILSNYLWEIGLDK